MHQQHRDINHEGDTVAHEGVIHPTYDKATLPNETNTQSTHNNDSETPTNTYSPEDNNITTESNSDMIARNIAYLHTQCHRSHKSKRLESIMRVELRTFQKHKNKLIKRAKRKALKTFKK